MPSRCQHKDLTSATQKATFYAESFFHSAVSTQRFTSNKSQRGQSTRQIEGSRQDNTQSCFVEQKRKWDKILSKTSNFDHTQAKNTSTKTKNLHLKRRVILQEALQEAGQSDQALSSGREMSIFRLSTTLLAKPSTSGSILSTATRYSWLSASSAILDRGASGARTRT